MKNNLIILISFIFIFVNAKPLQIKISKEANSQTTSVYFAGVSGDNLLSKYISSDLMNCGWFKVTTAKRAKYMIKGQVNNGNLTLSIFQGEYKDFSIQSVLSSNKVGTSHKVVDLILKKLFNIDGVCSTYIAFSAKTGKGKKEVFLANYDGTNVQKVTNSNTLCVEPDWMPSNKSIVYTMYSNSKMYIIEKNIIANRSRRLTSFPGLNASPAISPNGKYIAMILSKDGVVDLYIREINGKSIKRLTNNKATESSPCWSPNGQKICFVSDINGKPRLYVIGVNGSKLERIPTIGTEAVSPDWSFDNKIVYCSKIQGGYNIVYKDLNGVQKGGIITNSLGNWESPSWAPDGRHIICARTINGKSSLYKIDTWTHKKRNIINSSSNLSLPTWSGIN